MRNDVLDESDNEIKDDEKTTVIAEEDDNYRGKRKIIEFAKKLVNELGQGGPY